MGSVLVIVLLVLVVGPILGIYAVSRLGRLSSELATLRNEVRTLRAELATPDGATQRTVFEQAAEETESPAPNEDKPEEVGPEEQEPEPALAEEVDLEPEPVSGAAQASAEDPSSPLPESTERPAIAARTTFTQKSVSPEALEDDQGVTGRVSTRQRGFLDELGARWSVWVGGVALALGAIFFLRYSIEAGFFGPATRIAVATLLGVLMLGVGEWLRRYGPETQTEALQNAYIPGVLTAVGIITLLGSVYVSHALYGFIGPTFAFVLLGLLSLSALALGLLQGPAISGLGLVGSLATPLLVASSEPSYPVLYTYLVIVTAAAMALGRARNWAWLSVAGTGGPLVWAFIGVAWHGGDEFIVWLVYLAAVFSLTFMISVARLFPFASPGEKALHDEVLPVAVYGLSSVLLLIMLRADDTSVRGLYACLGGAAVGFFVARRWSSQVWSAALATVLSVFAIFLRGYEVVGSGPRAFGRELYTPVPIEGPWAHLFLITCVTSAFLVVVSVLVTRNVARPAVAGSVMPARIWASVGAVGPLAAFIPLWLLGTRGATQAAFGLVGIGLAIAAALATEWLYRMPADERDAEESRTSSLWSPLNLFAGSAGTAIAFGLFAGLDGVPLALALSAVIVATVFISMRRSIQILRMVPASFGALLMLHVLYTVGTKTGAVGETVIFNELWLYFALPAAACGTGAWLLSRLRTDIWSQALEALALSFAALFAVFQVRHYMNGGNLFAPSLTLEELSMQVLVGLSFSFGLSRIRDIGSSSLFSNAAMLAMGVSLLNLVFGSLLLLNPLLNEESLVKGGSILNSLVLAYLLPGLFLAAIAWMQRERRPARYIKTLCVVSLILLFTYLTTMVRLAYHTAGEMVIFVDPIRDVEIYAYTIVWCLFGLAIATVARFAGKNKIALSQPIQESLDLGVTAVLGITALSLALGNMIVANPMLSESAVVYGGLLINSLLAAYLLPGLLLGVAARLFSDGNHSWHSKARNIFGGLALLSMITYCTAMVRFAYQGGKAMFIFDDTIANVEQYTYSIVWLLFAIVLLVAGLVLKSREFRISSAAVMVLTVAKVFFVDMAALEGILRALSFVGLGAVLIAMGFVYQRLLARTEEPEVKAA